MKYSRINFHTDWKKVLFLTASFSLLSFLLVWILISSSCTGLAHWITLIRSGYSYSVKMNKTVGQNDYYVYDAGIGFTAHRDSETGINADVLMQTELSTYNDLVFWNAEKLEKYEVAVTKRLAESHGLKAGDKVCSKHIVDGEVREYEIRKILPEVSGARAGNHTVFSNGIIIMGYDELYAENISHNVLVFSEIPVTEMQIHFSDIPQDPVYREDEIIYVRKPVAAFLAVGFLLSVLLMAVFDYQLYSCIAAYFRRLIVLGFPEDELNKGYNRHVYGMAGFSMLAAVMLSLLMILLTGSGLPAVLILSVVVTAEVATLIIIVPCLRRHAWRT